MNVVPFPSATARTRLVVFAQPQAASFEHDDLFHVDWHLHCVLNSAIALEAARKLKLQIAHLTLPVEERAGRGNRQMPSALQARPSEPVFEYSFPSIFSGELFCGFVEQEGFSNIFLAGFPANDVALVSAIEAAKRNLDLTILRDCAPLLAIEDCDVAASDGAIFGTIGYYAGICNVRDFIAAMLLDVDLVSPHSPGNIASAQPETLSYLIDRVVDHAGRLSMDDCLDPLREAARRIERYCRAGRSARPRGRRAPHADK